MILTLDGVDVEVGISVYHLVYGVGTVTEVRTTDFLVMFAGRQNALSFLNNGVSTRNEKWLYKRQPYIYLQLDGVDYTKANEAHDIVCKEIERLSK